MAHRQPSSVSRASRRSVLGGLAAASVVAGGVLTGTAAADTTAPSATGRMPKGLRPGGAYDQYIAQLAAQDNFSGTVMVAHRGRPVLARAYGMADKERSVPNRVDTVYALASASKPFTGLAIVQLAQANELNFHDPLGKYLAGFPAEIANTVTIHHLLTHTSGMGDITGKEHDNWKSATAVMEGKLELIRKEPLHFAPGTANRYSNNGYDTLGSIVAKVSGSFHDYVREHIFAPAEMASSGYYTRPQWLTDQRLAHPYWLSPAGRRVDALRHPDELGDFPNAANLFIGTGGGNGFSTAADLVRFATALHEGKLVEPGFAELYLTGKFPTVPRGTKPPSVQASYQAYGAPTFLFNGHWLFGHGGGAAGESANWTIYRGLDWVGVVLCNYDQVAIESIIDQERRLITDPA